VDPESAWAATPSVTAGHKRKLAVGADADAELEAEREAHAATRAKVEWLEAELLRTSSEAAEFAQGLAERLNTADASRNALGAQCAALYDEKFALKRRVAELEDRLRGRGR
jgi:hypothetical protein